MSIHDRPNRPRERRRTVGGGRWTAGWTVGGGVDGGRRRRAVDGGRWMVDGGRRAADGGLWTVDGGRRAADGGRRGERRGGRRTADGGRGLRAVGGGRRAVGGGRLDRHNVALYAGHSAFRPTTAVTQRPSLPGAQASTINTTAKKPNAR